MSRGAMGSHHSARSVTNDWLTPPAIIEALGPFDLDPACPPDMPWRTAARMLTEDDDGLSAEWSGRVWLNPPYSNIAPWMARMADHGSGIALVFARIETRWWFAHVWPHCAAVLFPEGRLYFHRPDGEQAAMNAGAPSALIAYSDTDRDAVASSGISGALITGAELAGAVS